VKRTVTDELLAIVQDYAERISEALAEIETLPVDDEVATAYYEVEELIDELLTEARRVAWFDGLHLARDVG
jgi:CHASE3 domain sensor protein